VNVTLLEHGDGADGTNIGINYRPLYALQELGVLDQVLAIGQSYAADKDSRFEALFDANGKKLETGTPPLLGESWTLPISSVRLFRPELSEIMQNMARAQGAELLLGHTYRSIEPGPDGVEVELSTGDKRTYDLVVGADGIHSGLRERFFPDVPSPTYTGNMSCRVIFDNAPDDWRGGQHLAPDGSNQKLITAMYPGNRFYLASGTEMESRWVEQEEGREILRERIRPFLGHKMFDEIYERITDELHVIITPLEWIFVPPPWHRGRIVLIGDAVHATAPTIGSAGGMALEDGVVLGQELESHDDVEAALTSFVNRRKDRAKLVVETSATLVRSHHEHRSHQDETAMRYHAYSQLVAPY
jgi:2-polyprenyl-6-methoxyphenol hydroxylase-like FAD-dependent oxidoreductase